MLRHFSFLASKERQKKGNSVLSYLSLSSDGRIFSISGGPMQESKGVRKDMIIFLGQLCFLECHRPFVQSKFWLKGKGGLVCAVSALLTQLYTCC